MEDDPALTRRPSGDGATSRGPVRDKARTRRRFLLIYGAAAGVALVLAATTTVAGPQRLLTVGLVVVAVAGLVAVLPWVRRSPKPLGAEERTSQWVAAMGTAAMIITGNIIRSVGPDDGGWAALPATLLTSALLILPVLMVVDAALRRRRARKLAEQPSTSALSERPNPRP